MKPRLHVCKISLEICSAFFCNHSQTMETEVNSNMEMYVTVPLKVAHHLSKTQVYLSAKTSGVNFSLLRSTVSHGTTKKDRVYQPSLL